MQAVTITQITPPELKELIESSLRQILNSIERTPSQEADEILNVPGAADFLKIEVATIYSKTSRGELPVMKRGKRLYFSKAELIDYLKTGRKKTNKEIESEAEKYLNKKKSY